MLPSATPDLLHHGEAHPEVASRHTPGLKAKISTLRRPARSGLSCKASFCLYRVRVPRQEPPRPLHQPRVAELLSLTQTFISRVNCYDQ